MLLPKPYTTITHLRRVRVLTIAIKGLIEGTILYLGNGANSMIQSIVSGPMVASNLWIEVSRHQVAIVGGKAHGENSKGDDGVVGI